MTAVALVTGGAGGIGRAICARLAQSGYAVLAGDVSVAAEPDPARAGPGEILDWPMDVTDDASVAWAVAAAAALGSLTAVVNCAGVLREAHSDAMSQRDAGWLQLYAETSQEALDLHIQAFRIAEELSVPVMVCMDGFLLTHASERADIPEQAQVDAFLPRYEPRQVLDPGDPVSIGAMVGPEAFTEVRYLAFERMRQSSPCCVRGPRGSSSRSACRWLTQRA